LFGDGKNKPPTGELIMGIRVSQTAVLKHRYTNKDYRPTRNWDAIDEQMEREAKALRGRMVSAGQRKTLHEKENKLSMV